jgi:hypothetical protein
MPLRPEMRPYYGPAWQALRLELIAEARNRCRECGREYPSDELTGAHLRHDPRDRQRDRLAVYCFSCHARHDTPHRILLTRRRRARRHGQLWLYPAMAWEGEAAWLVPDEFRQFFLFDDRERKDNEP